jgi:heme/copper-type cytochrome/quinol oxidase subunit 2
VFDNNKIFHSLNWDLHFPSYIFWFVFAVIAVLSFLYRFSLLPSLGIITNFYLMTQLGRSNWIAFAAWLILGLLIYFVYSYKNSKISN